MARPLTSSRTRSTGASLAALAASMTAMSRLYLAINSCASFIAVSASASDAPLSVLDRASIFWMRAMTFSISGELTAVSAVSVMLHALHGGADLATGTAADVPVDHPL